MAQNWQINPASGDYVMQGGAPEQTDSLHIPAYFRWKIPQGSWLYAPNAAYGATFRNIQKKPQGGDMTPLEQAGSAALQPILDDGRAMRIVVEGTNSLNRNGAILAARIERSRGIFDNLELPAITTSGD